MRKLFSRLDRRLRPVLAVMAACGVLAGWSFWTAGIFDSDIAADLRTSSVWADPGYHLDVTAAEQVVGNRRLAVVFLDTTDRVGGPTCESLRRAADGVLVVIVTRDPDGGLDSYPCSWLYGDDDEAFGRNFAIESVIADGLGGFADRPLLAVKQIVTSYDNLANREFVPQQAREVQASAPRYLLAFLAVGGVVIGAGMLYLGGRQAGRAVAQQRQDDADRRDAGATVWAGLTGIARSIFELDRKYTLLRNTSGQGSPGVRPWRSAASSVLTADWIDQYRHVCRTFADLTDRANQPQARLADFASEVSALESDVETLQRMAPPGGARTKPGRRKPRHRTDRRKSPPHSFGSS